MKKLLIFPLLILMSSAAAAQSIDEKPPNIDLDAYYGYSEEDERGRLDSFLADLLNFGARGVIDIQFKASRNRNERIKRIRRILKHVRNRKVDLKRLSFRVSEGTEDILILLSETVPFKGLIEADEKHLIVNASEIEAKLKTIFSHPK